MTYSILLGSIIRTLKKALIFSFSPSTTALHLKCMVVKILLAILVQCCLLVVKLRKHACEHTHIDTVICALSNAHQRLYANMRCLYSEGLSM